MKPLYFNPASKRHFSFGLALIILTLAGCQKEQQVKNGPAPAPRADSVPAQNNSAAPQYSYADVIERASPAVVTIRSERRVRAPRQFPFFGNPLFGDPPGGQLPGGQPRRSQVQLGLGSGVIVHSDGTILTNHHVVDGAEQIKVELSNHRSFNAKLVGSDPPSDLAVLKIDAKDLSVLALGDSDRVRVGDIALAIGNPLGIGQTVTAGIISAKSRSTGLSDGSFEDFLQTDAPINQGNSGGALINARGRVDWHQFADSIDIRREYRDWLPIPSNMARNVMDQLAKTGNVPSRAASGSQFNQ